MLYLISKIWPCLLLAAIFGLVLGWLFRRVGIKNRKRDTLLQSDNQINIDENASLKIASTVEEIEKKRVSLQDENNQLRINISSLERDLRSSKMKMNSLEEGYRSRIKDLNAQIKDRDIQISELEKLLNKNSYLDELKEQKDVLEKELKRHKESKDELKTRLQSIQSDYDNRLSLLSKENKSHEFSIKFLQEELSRLKREREEYKQDLDRTSDKLLELQNSLDEHKKRYNELVIERDKLKKKNQELEAKNEYLQKEQQSSIKDKKDMELHTKELSTLKSDIKRYKDENFNLKRELDEIKEKFKSKKRQIGELEEKFRKEKERYKDIDDDIASYKRRISELENQKLSLEEQMRSKFKEGNKSSELQGEIDSLKQDLKNDKLTILRLRAEGRDKEQEHNRQLLKSQEEIEQLKNKLKNLQKDDKHGMKKPSFLKEPNGKPDNLELIKGIGSTLHKVLNELGVFHFEQIASWGKKEIAWVNDHLAFSGRIEREEWVQQAKKLLKGEQTEVSKEKKSNKRFKHSKHLRKK